MFSACNLLLCIALGSFLWHLHSQMKSIAHDLPKPDDTTTSWLYNFNTSFPYTINLCDPNPMSSPQHKLSSFDPYAKPTKVTWPPRGTSRKSWKAPHPYDTDACWCLLAWLNGCSFCIILYCTVVSGCLKIGCDEV